MSGVWMRAGLLVAGLTYGAGAWGLVRLAPVLVELGLPAVAVPVVWRLWAIASISLLAGALLLQRTAPRREVLRAPAAHPRTSFL
jgi:hypothetical protein